MKLNTFSASDAGHPCWEIARIAMPQYSEEFDKCKTLKEINQKTRANKQINSDNYFSGQKPPTEIIAGY